MAPGIRLLYGSRRATIRPLRCRCRMPGREPLDPPARALPQDRARRRHGGDQRARRAHALSARSLRTRQPHRALAESASHGCKILIFDSNNHFPRQDAFSASWPSSIGHDRMDSARGGWHGDAVDVASRTLYSATVPIASAWRTSFRLRHLTRAQNQRPVLGHGWCPVDPVTFESQVVKHVHVIGDACIAGPCPKRRPRRAARHCNARGDLRIAGRPRAPVAELDSVCYSLLSPATALAMHGRFRISGDRIEQIEAGNGPKPTPRTAAHVSEASAWYRISVPVFRGLRRA